MLTTYANIVETIVAKVERHELRKRNHLSRVDTCQSVAVETQDFESSQWSKTLPDALDVIVLELESMQVTKSEVLLNASVFMSMS